MTAGRPRAEGAGSIIKHKPAAAAVDFERRRRGLALLLARLTGAPADPARVASLIELFERPNDLLAALRAAAPGGCAELLFVGPLERRFALLCDGQGWSAVGFGAYGPDALPEGVAARLGKVRPDGPQAWALRPSADLRAYLARPRVYLAALYHPEVFPLPRLSLAISDLIRAARCAGVSRVIARDMQLGWQVADLAREIVREAPDLLGISATFGQHDVLDALLAEIARLGWPSGCQLVFGGSLSALNQRVLLEAYPRAIVATGPGERTIGELVGWLRGERRLDAVSGIAYRARAGADVTAAVRQTGQLSPREVDDMLPELDLLDATLRARGVVQLESSRGCSYACSFCPRLHKGIWAGDDPLAGGAVLPDIARLLDRHPEIARKVFLVDEEFFGYRPNDESERRVSEVAANLAAHGLRFETSSRADQVYRRNRGRAWHVARFRVWRRLVEDGLDRCLFGIESGVDSILERFNKKTTGQQNSVAIRALSLLGVPPRYTYITFDPLMSRGELVQTYRYLGRTDLLLPARPELDEGGVFDLAGDDGLGAAPQAGAPFYRAVSYMLVSIECLEGAPYTQKAGAHGLLGAFNPNMGRFEARYLDPDIGLFSDCAQRWIDRNFALDYLLKSIEKYTQGTAHARVRSMRALIKDYAFDLLGLMIGLWDADSPELHFSAAQRRAIGLHAHAAAFRAAAGDAARKQVVLQLMDAHFAAMRAQLQAAFTTLKPDLPPDEQVMIAAQIDSWSHSRSWTRINELSA
jgi:hypothetical protein